MARFAFNHAVGVSLNLESQPLLIIYWNFNQVPPVRWPMPGRHRLPPAVYLYANNSYSGK